MNRGDKISILIFIAAVFMWGLFIHRIYAVYKYPISYKEAYAFITFQRDPAKEGQYIQDFNTGKWYDIDGKNPKAPSLTTWQMRTIPNIRERIIDYYIETLVVNVKEGE